MDEVASPCIATCTLDQTERWCLGCGRTVEEIAGWQDAGRKQKLEILKELPARLARLAVNSKL
ncbi:MAG: DUF1289 domain-containing protein [Sphingorhabdus sp.]|jgi:uncharacterized protein|uniref:DUF1289 domain-containing protein n=1 Tax=Sphingorhabdus sp. TaxID=1902408 RepID=UPI003C830317